MTAKEQIEQIAKLNRLGEEYCAAEDNDRRRKLCSEIFLELDEIFRCKYSKTSGLPLNEALGAFFEQDWKSFDAEKGALYDFANFRLERRSVDMYRKDAGVKKAKNPETGKYAYMPPDHLESPIDEKHTFQEQLESRSYNPEDEVVARMTADAKAMELLTIILNMRERLQGKAKNEQRITYFRMFFTDSVVDIIQNIETPESYVNHERDLFQALKTEFLDFFMNRVCRSVQEISDCPMKLYGEIVNDCPMEHMRHPMPNDVYIAYVNAKENFRIQSPGTISNQRNEYYKFLRANDLC